MFTRSLLKPFLTFSLFTLMLLPQISGPSTAFAAGPSSEKDPINPICLDVSNSTAFADVVSVVGPPSGKAVSYELTISVTNRCTADNPASNIAITGTVDAPCAEESTPGKSITIDALFDGTLDTTKSFTKSAQGINSCVISVNGVPTTSVVPASIAIHLTANGNSASGRLVSSHEFTFPVTW